MNILSKTLLAIAVGGLTVGSIVAHYGDNASPVALAAVLPLGAVAFGLFLIVFMLQKEVALFDREQARKKPTPNGNTASTPKKSEACSQPTVVQLKEKTV